MARKTATQDTTAKVDKALRGLFRRLEQRPIPGRLASVVDQLDEAAEAPLRKRG